MAFKKLIINKKHDCEDFKSFLFDRRYCKHSFKCANAGHQYITRRHYAYGGWFDLRCTGIEKDEKMKADPNMPEMRDPIRKR